MSQIQRIMTLKYVVLFIYFGILFLIGILASRRITDQKDFFVGGKKLGFWAVAFSSRATGESAWLLLGVTGMGALLGVQAFWVVVGELIGVGVCWLWMAKPFKRLSDKYDSITIPDYLVSRFKPKTHALRIIAAGALSIFVVIYVSAQIDATGQAFESFLGWNYFVGAIIGFLIVLLYSFIGGFVAVVWSDFFQGLLMLLGLVILPVVALFSYEGAGLLTDLKAIDADLVNPWGAGGFSWINLLTIVSLLSIGLGFLGSPQVFVRFMSVRSEKEINKGRWVAILFTVLADCGAVLIGILARLIFTDAGTDPEQVLGGGAEDSLITLANEYLPVLLVAIYIAVVLSAIMSTIDSLLVVASSAITRDFYQQIFHPEKSNDPMTRLSRWVTIIMSLTALAIAITVALLVPGRTIFWFVIFGWSGIAATFCPMIILSLFWRSYNSVGAIASMITGFLSIPLFKFLLPSIDGVGMYFDTLQEMFPSFVLSLLAGYIATKFSSKNQKSIGEVA